MTELRQAAVAMQEMFQTFKAAGFSEDQALRLVVYMAREADAQTGEQNEKD